MCGAYCALFEDSNMDYTFKDESIVEYKIISIII